MPEMLQASPIHGSESHREATRPIGKVSHNPVWPRTEEDSAMSTLSLSRAFQLLLKATIMKVPVQDDHVVDNLSAEIMRELDDHGLHPSEYHGHDQQPAGSSPHHKLRVVEHGSD